MNKIYFESLCKTTGVKKGGKIIDGRYKPWLSRLDDQYYSGGDVWDAKTNALNAALRRFTKEEINQRLR
ncbi:MAG: hypothetical protein WAU36_12015 [Cyclobacteriaceae bacterium]